MSQLLLTDGKEKYGPSIIEDFFQLDKKTQDSLESFKEYIEYQQRLVSYALGIPRSVLIRSSNERASCDGR